MRVSWRHASSSTCVGDLRAPGRRVSGRPSTGSLDEQRGVRPRGARDDDPADAHAGTLGEQQRVRLVLDVLEPGEVHGRARVLVEEAAPDLGDELRVGLVASEDADPERPVCVAGRASSVPSGGCVGARSTCEPSMPSSASAALTCARGRAPTGRPEHEVHGGADPPTEHHRGEHRVRIPVPRYSDGQREQEDEQLTEPAHRSGRGTGPAVTTTATMTASRTTGNDGVASPSRVTMSRLCSRSTSTTTSPPSSAAEEPGDDARDGHVAGEPPAARDERGHDDESERPERAEPVQRSGRTSGRSFGSPLSSS